MNKPERKKLSDKLAASIESVLSRVDKKATSKTKKQIRQASKQLVKKFTSAFKKAKGVRKQKVNKTPGKKTKAKKTGK